MNDYLIAIETGGTKLQLVLGTADGEILYRKRTKISKDKGRNGILQQIETFLPELEREAERYNGKISKIGIGYGGPVDTRKGVTLCSAQVSGWDNFPLENYIQEKTGHRTFVYNDSNAASWGEYCKGVGNNSKIFFYSNIGSGVGGGVVINGKLFDGQGFGAAEFGQTYMYNPEPVLDCDFPVNKFELGCSGWSIQNKLRSAAIPQDSLLKSLCKQDQNEITSEIWGEAVRLGDEYALKILDQVAEYYALGLCNAICFYSPEIIAIGGGVSLIGDPLITRVRKYVDRFVYKNNRGRYQILKSYLDEDVVLVGTLLLAGTEQK